MRSTNVIHRIPDERFPHPDYHELIWHDAAGVLLT